MPRRSPHWISRTAVAGGWPSCGERCLQFRQLRAAGVVLEVDGDGAGFGRGARDCDDDDPTVFPGAEELCDNGQNDNCNGLIDEGCYAVGGASAGGSSAEARRDNRPVAKGYGAGMPR